MNTGAEKQVKKDDKKARRAARVQKKAGNSPNDNASESLGTWSKVQVIYQGESEKTTDNPKEPSSKKPLTKAERRAMQEAQRKAKEEKKQKDSKQKPGASESKPAESQASHQDSLKPKAVNITRNSKEKREKQVKLISKTDFFSHLPNHRSAAPLIKSSIHPMITQIGLQFYNGLICGSNARAVALICALKQVISDSSNSNQGEFVQELLSIINLNIEYLNSCRPISVSMESVIKYLKPLIQSYRMEEPVKAKYELENDLDRFYYERIISSDEHIAKITAESLSDGDVIITFGHSSLVFKVITYCYKHVKNISVIVVDSRPKLEGREMVRKLVENCRGISCSYILINSLSYVMPRATKVLLGAHAVLSNGYIMSRLGTSQVAVMAKAYNKPVLVCCETYKFSDKMRTDSIVFNELGNSDEIMKLDNNLEPLKARNLLYDVTPPYYITGLVTESGVIPCTSAPAVIRVKQQYDFVDVRTS